LPMLSLEAMEVMRRRAPERPLFAVAGMGAMRFVPG